MHPTLAHGHGPNNLHPVWCSFVNFADAGAAERARQAMNGMRAGDKILHVMVQTNQGALPSGRSHSGGLDPATAAATAPNGMAAAAAMLAAAAGQPGLATPQPDWQLLAPAAGPMMW